MKISYQSMSILLVDAVSTGLDTLHDYLSDFAFYRVHTAKGADEALKQLKSNKVNLVISAWKMQPLSGFQLLEQVRADNELQHLPVLLMIDRHDKHLEDMGAKGGASGFINLPLKSEAVVKTVEQVLAPFIDEEEEQFLQHYSTARKAVRNRKWDVAIDEFEAALETKDDVKVRLAMARALKQKGDLGEAEKTFKEVLRSDGDALAAYSGLASVLQEGGRLHDALRVLQGAEATAAKLKASGQMNASIHFYMGEIELQLKMVREALEHFKQASEEDPDNTELQIKIGDSLLSHNLHQESEEYYEKALDMNPELAHVYNRLGIAYRKQNKFDLAIELYIKALQFHPEDEHLHYNLARSYWEKQELEQACRWLEKALEVNPKFKDAKRFLKGIRRQMEKSRSSPRPRPPRRGRRFRDSPGYRTGGSVTRQQMR